MNENLRLFRYLSAEAALKFIETRSLRVGRPNEFNDPFEWRLGIDNIERLSPTELENQKRRNEELLNWMTETFGVFCCSSVLDDPILWSHYSSSHRGLAIELKPENEFIEVTYNSTDLLKVPMNYTREEGLEIFKNLIKQKSPSWSYEKEWRGVVKLNECEVAGEMYFKTISDEILSVAIGCRSAIGPNYIRRALDMNGWTNVTVAKAHLSQSKYKIEFE
ncbi:MAG: DUF2971 domain-containing protein [Limisphaerales bacterium]